VNVAVKVFPADGLCDQKSELRISLENGSLNELGARLEEVLGVNPFVIESLMFLHNGRALDEKELIERENIVFADGDTLWLLPRISGG